MGQSKDMPADLKQHKGSEPVEAWIFTLWPLLAYLKEEWVLGGGPVLGQLVEYFVSYGAESWPHRPQAAWWSGINFCPVSGLWTLAPLFLSVTFNMASTWLFSTLHAPHIPKKAESPLLPAWLHRLC